MERVRLVRSWIAGLAALAILVVAAAAQGAGSHEGSDGNGSPGNPMVVPSDAMAFGRTYAEWAVVWWQWALTNPCATNVILDPDGRFGADNQSGPVWFLAGGVPTTRTLGVPTGKFLFFPLINVNNDYPCPDPNFHPDPGQTLEDFLTNGNSVYPGAKFYIDPTTDLQAEIDGQSLGNLFAYRATSRLFTFTGNADLATCFDPCITGSPQSGVSDGFWLMLTPLSAGAHTIHFFANGLFSQEETYHLTVGGHASGATPDRATPTRTASWGKLKTLYR